MIIFGEIIFPLDKVYDVIQYLGNGILTKRWFDDFRGFSENCIYSKKLLFPISTSLLQNIPAYKPCKDMPIIFNDMLVYFNCNFETFFSITEKRFWFILLFSFSNEKSNPSTKNKLNLQLHNYLQKARFQGKQLICTSHFSFLQETFNRAG